MTSRITICKRFYLTFFLTALLLPTQILTQVSFERHYGSRAWDEGTGVEQTADGGYVIVGYHGIADDVYLIRTDESGETLWTKTYGGSDFDYGLSVHQTSDGGFIVAGYTYSFSPGADLDVYLLKTDANGRILWQRNYALNGFGLSVDETTDGGFVIAGYTDSAAGAENDDVFLMRTNANGQVIWLQTYGGSERDQGRSTQQTRDGGFIIAGKTFSFGALGSDVYLIKTDVNGNEVWARTYGGLKSDQANSVQQTADGGYIITGWTQSFSVGGTDVYLLKTDADGDTVWTGSYGGFLNDGGSSVRETSDGGYIIAGWTSSFGAGDDDVYLLKIDSNGHILWTETFGSTGEDYANSVRQTTDGGYIIAGYAEVNGGDVYLIKTVEESPTAVHSEIPERVPDSFYLAPNYPNPFNPQTRLRFQLPEASHVVLRIYNTLGQEIRTLVDSPYDAGLHSVRWDGRDNLGKTVSSGIYLSWLKAGVFVQVRKMTMLR